MIRSTTADRLAARLEGADPPALLDVRPMAASNGWPGRPDERGGRIPKASPFPAVWLDDPSPDHVLELLAGAGAVPDRETVVCGWATEGGQKAAQSLEGLGFERVEVLHGGAAEWLGDPLRPVDRLARWPQLVEPGWLAGVLAGREVPAPPSGPFVVLHVSFRNRGDYERGHVPGAVYLDTLELEEPERWNRRPADEVEAALPAHGIAFDTTVLVTGRTGNPDMSQAEPGREAGQIAANRVAALLLWAGVDDVRVLDGGLGAWEAASHPLETDDTAPSPVTEFGRRVPARPEVMIDVDEAQALLADPAGALVSIRSWAEFIDEERPLETGIPDDVPRQFRAE